MTPKQFFKDMELFTGEFPKNPLRAYGFRMLAALIWYMPVFAFMFGYWIAWQIHG